MRKMTKRLMVVTLTVIMSLTCAGLSASASSSNVKVKVDGQNVQFDNNLGAPFIDDNNRTMVPFRAVANFMKGVEVEWDDAAKVASFYRRNVLITDDEGLRFALMDVGAHFPIDTNQAWQDFRIREKGGDLLVSSAYLTKMDTKSKIVNSRTYAPIRYLAEALYCDVGWDDASRTVIVKTPDNVGQRFRETDADKPDKFITSDSMAREYAKIFLRRVYGDKNPSLEYLGEEYEYLEGFERGWIFDCEEQDGVVFIYISDDGETWYSYDDEEYEIWE